MAVLAYVWSNDFCDASQRDSSGAVRAFQVYLLFCIIVSSQLGTPEEQLIILPVQSFKINRNDSTLQYAPELQR